MKLFKNTFKLKRSESQRNLNVEDSQSVSTENESLKTTRSQYGTLNELKNIASHPYSQSQPNLSRIHYIHSNFDPSIILPSFGALSEEEKNLQPDECVQKALYLHEQGKLELATELLKTAASKNHPLGLFLLGISLRHGWGCEVDTLLAFQCLQHSAESAIVDLNTIKNSDCSAAKHELTIAIHELGICFRHGWGVTRNKQTAAYYFELAANLGDPDSQNELGYCYMHGDGVKKDLYLSAKYFRLAHEQGMGQVGNSWIFKEKYDKKKKSTITTTNNNITKQ